MKSGIQSWKNLLRFTLYFFSIGGLLKTLLVPWYRDTYKREKGIWAFFEYLGFAIFSRVIGLIIRTITILIGTAAIVIVLALFPVFLLLPITLYFEDLVRMGSLGREWAYPQTFYLNKHGRNMRFMSHYLVIDHDNGIAQIERTLSRKTQQNALVIGSQGIGKTTRLGYLARRMYYDLSLPKLNGKRLFELFPEDISHEELELCIKEAVRAKNIILVIENIERFNILGILEPYFENHNFQIILTTDFSSYHNTFKHHANLNRVAEVIEFLPPDDETTFLYLLDWCHHNHVLDRFSDETLSSVITLTNTLIMNTHQPEKSIDLMEELSGLDDEIITTARVEALISEKTGIPLGALQKNEREKLIHLEEVLKQHIIGQEQAVHAIASALKRARAGVVDSKKPIGSFLFLGTTGVGKTHTAKMLAQYYFGGEGMMSRFDMSEFHEIDSSVRFMDRLGTAVEDKPYSLVFFDEIEKAHPDILNIFLQILDEGQFHTPTGRLISFRNTIIICTSNAGSHYMMTNEVDSEELLIEHIVSQGILRPEFINRFDGTILYKPLDRESIKKVTRIMLEDLNRHLKKKQNLTITITEDLIDILARKGHDPKFGVRPLKRIIQDQVETAVADALLMDAIPENRVIDIHLERD
jgi:ATP-dependent Clp protease ATP-binding subunit ClpA